MSGGIRNNGLVNVLIGKKLFIPNLMVLEIVKWRASKKAYLFSNVFVTIIYYIDT